MTDKLTTYFVVDPTIAFNNEKHNLFVVNGHQQSYNQITFTNPSFQSIQTANVVIASTQALCRDSYFRLKFQVQCAATPQNGATNCLTLNAFGFKSNPFMRMLNSLQVVLGNYTDNIVNIYQFHDLLDRWMHNSWSSISFWSGSCTNPDRCIDWQSFYNTNLNPLGNYLNQSFGNHVVGQAPRTDRLSVISNPAGAGTFKLRCDILCPMISSVFSSNMQQRLAIARVGTFIINLSFLQDVSKMFALNPYFTSITEGTFILDPTVAMTLQYFYHTVDVSDIDVPLQCLETVQYQVFYENANAVASQTQASYTSTQRTYSINPQYLFYAMRQPFPTTQALTVATPDVYLPIQQLSTTYLRPNVLVANTDDMQIYDFSIVNGLRASYIEFSGGIRDSSGALYPIPAPLVQGGQFDATQEIFLNASPAVIDPVKQLMTGADWSSAAGMTSNLASGFTHTTTITYYNQTSGSITPVFVLLSVTPTALYEISPGNWVNSSYVINPATVEERAGTVSSLAEAQLFDPNGAGFFSSLKNLASKALNKANEYGLIDKALSYAPKFVDKSLDYISSQKGERGLLGKIGDLASKHGDKLRHFVDSKVSEARGHGLDEFDVAKLRGEMIYGMHPDLAREVYNYHMKNLSGGQVISREHLQNATNYRNLSMADKLRK